MDFVVEKDQSLIPYVLSQILDSAVTGITLSDPDQPDNPIVFANKTFERITGYTQSEILGRNCRFLQGSDHDQSAIDEIREAVAARRPVTVLLRNYRKDGSLFFNRFQLLPLFDHEGRVIYFLGAQEDVTERVSMEEELARLRQRVAELGG